MKRVLLLALCISFVAWLAWAAQRPSLGPTKVALAQPVGAIGAIHPRLSPDGSRLVFSYQGALWTAPREGKVMTRLTHGDGFDLEPAWSPDGKRIAFSRTPYPGARLRILDAQTGDDVPLPKEVEYRSYFANQKIEWHPNGDKILGPLGSGGKAYGLAWLDLKTGDVTSVATLNFWGRYALSPDGNWIVYTTTMDVDGQQTGNDGPQADLWKIPAAGGKAVKIVRFPARIHDLCFAADGSSLIVTTDLGGAYYDLWQVPLTDSLRGMRKLTSGQADEDRPSVSRDGRWLAYSDNRAAATAIVVRDLTTGDEQTLVFRELDFRCPTATLKLTTMDAASKSPVCARVALLDDRGKYHAPPGALYRMLRGYTHFYCDRSAEFVVPAGKYKLRAFRGPEYKMAAHDFEIRPGETHTLNVPLTRWTHAAASGWYSGENHIHANYGYGQWFNTPRTMLEQCTGEDLNVCNFMVANSDTDGIFDRAFFRGGPDPLSTSETILYWNQEFRSTLWGHMTLVNLRQLVEPIMTGFKDTTNPWDIPTNADIAERTHWQKGVASYTHVAQNPDDPFQNPYAARGLPIDVALGRTDMLDINNSYAGSVPIWHRLLNCGFRLPATAGTDCFLNRINSRLPGGDRVYVQLQGPLNYADWIAGMKAGRSFVSNGPMLEFRAEDSTLGETIKLPAAKKIRLRGQARSQFPLAKVEVLYNGKVVATAKMAQDDLSATLDHDLTVDSSGWVALRATGPGHPDSPTPILYAHTNPIYVEVAGVPLNARADALFFLKWIDRLALEQRGRDRIPTDELRRHVQAQIEAARAVYGKLAQ